MADPTDRLRIGKVLAGVVKEHGTNINVDTLTDELAKSLIPAQYLERFGRAIIDSVHGIPSSSATPHVGPSAAAPRQPDLGSIGVGEHQMRQEALSKIAKAVGRTPTRVGDHGAQIYRTGGGPLMYVRTSAPDWVSGDHSKYWFGLDTDWFDNPSSFFVFQCGIDFTLVVPVADWIPFRDRLGQASKGKKRQPHVHREGGRIELREQMRSPSPFIKDLSPWVEAWNALATAHGANSP